MMGEQPELSSERMRQIAEGNVRESIRQDRSKAEALRVKHWHKTYNAALTGILANATNGLPDVQLGPDSVGRVRDACVRHADAAHGRLKP